MKNDWTRGDDILRWFRVHKVQKFIPHGGVLVDLGCGHEGYLLKKLSSHVKQGFGFDKDAPEISEANFEIKNLELESRVPLEDNSVDVVVMLASLEHFADEEAILREARRILKPGGAVLITVPTSANRPLLEILARLGIISKAEIFDHKRYYTKEVLAAALWQAGFNPESIKLSYWQLGLNLFARAIK